MQIMPQYQSEGWLTFLTRLLCLSNPRCNLWRIASDSFIHHMTGLRNGLVVRSRDTDANAIACSKALLQGIVNEGFERGVSSFSLICCLVLRNGITQEPDGKEILLTFSHIGRRIPVTF